MTELGEVVVAATDIEKYFGSVVHSGRVTKQKPHPESLLLAMRELGVTPAETVMVGDMRHDIEIGSSFF